MSRSEVMDTEFRRYEVITCDACAAAWTRDVCEKKGWLLNDEGRPGAQDLCERCQQAGAPKHTNGKKAK